MLLNRLLHPVDAAIVEGFGEKDGWTPVGVGLDQAQDCFEVGGQGFGALPVRLVHNEDVGDLQKARLEHLHGIAALWDQDDNDGVGRLHYGKLSLAHARGLDEDGAQPGGVECSRRAPDDTRQAAGCPSCGQAAEKDAAVKGVGLHADPVAKDGAARVRAGGVHGKDAPTSRPCALHRAVRRPTRVLLPLPGGPVTPTT